MNDFMDIWSGGIRRGCRLVHHNILFIITSAFPFPWVDWYLLIPTFRHKRKETIPTPTMNAEIQPMVAVPPLAMLLRSSFPPLDPNGQPLSMILRGASAELRDLRLTLSTNPQLRDNSQMLVLAPANGEDKDGNKFGDVETERIPEKLQKDGLQSGNETTIKDISGEDNAARTERNKRTRGGTDDVSDVDDDDEEDYEYLLLYAPSVRCTCSSWSMEDVSGEVVITSLRVLFLAEKVNDEEETWNDVAIAGRCIALHAVDSLPPSDDDNELGSSHHIYCQLTEPVEEDGDIRYTPAMNMMFAPSAIVDEVDDVSNSNGDNEEMDDDCGSSEKVGVIEVYFRPAPNDGEDDAKGSQSNKCQVIFDALTKLASLNPEGESIESFNGGGGGLFSMLSLMAGMGNHINGFDAGMAVDNYDDDDDDDEMVVRLGGSNNIVANDDDSEGATDEDRQAMLCRLDDMLVVPPEYEIASSTDGQFDDAEEDDDEIL